MASEIFNELEATKVKELFDAVDTDHDGLIKASELVDLCVHFGHELSAERAAVIMPTSWCFTIVGYIIRLLYFYIFIKDVFLRISKIKLRDFTYFAVL